MEIYQAEDSAKCTGQTSETLGSEFEKNSAKLILVIRSAFVL